MSAFNNSGNNDLSIHFGDFLATIAFWNLPAVAETVQVVRSNIHQSLEAESAVDLERTIAVISELVGNSVVHAATDMCVILERWQYMIKVVVEDFDHQLPTMRSLDVAMDSGRGMHIVEQYSDVWGYEITDQGKRIWAGFTTDAT